MGLQGGGRVVPMSPARITGRCHTPSAGFPKAGCSLLRHLYVTYPTRLDCLVGPPYQGWADLHAPRSSVFRTSRRPGIDAGGRGRGGRGTEGEGGGERGGRGGGGGREGLCLEQPRPRPWPHQHTRPPPLSVAEPHVPVAATSPDANPVRRLRRRPSRGFTSGQCGNTLLRPAECRWPDFWRTHDLLHGDGPPRLRTSPVSAEAPPGTRAVRPPRGRVPQEAVVRSAPAPCQRPPGGAHQQESSGARGLLLRSPGGPRGVLTPRCPQKAPRRRVASRNADPAAAPAQAPPPPLPLPSHTRCADRALCCRGRIRPRAGTPPERSLSHIVRIPPRVPACGDKNRVPKSRSQSHHCHACDCPRPLWAPPHLRTWGLDSVIAPSPPALTFPQRQCHV